MSETTRKTGTAPVAEPRREVRQTRRGKQRSEEMLRTAADLFLEKGYDQTSVDEVIQRSGGSKTHIYREFGDKEGLFLAAVKYLCAEVQLAVQTLDVSGLAFEAGLRQLSKALVRMLLAERHLALQRLVFAEASRFQKTGEIWFASGPEVTHGIFSRFFAQAMQGGLLRRTDPDLTARLYCDLLTGHILDRAWLGIGEKPSPAVAKRTIDAAVELFLTGYGLEERG
ncbi:MAG TPA: TetR/AcrR family transcriptional regulator [Granulicella sp.]|jgi:AcrR family transcriptional regulator|nr:TetR/AcrR family transcriptional regulator [Granulicella sp.]